MSRVCRVWTSEPSSCVPGLNPGLNRQTRLKPGDKTLGFVGFHAKQGLAGLKWACQLARAGPRGGAGDRAASHARAPIGHTLAGMPKSQALQRNCKPGFAGIRRDKPGQGDTWRTCELAPITIGATRPRPPSPSAPPGEPTNAPAPSVASAGHRLTVASSRRHQRAVWHLFGPVVHRATAPPSARVIPARGCQRRRDGVRATPGNGHGQFYTHGTPEGTPRVFASDETLLFVAYRKKTVADLLSAKLQRGYARRRSGSRKK